MALLRTSAGVPQEPPSPETQWRPWKADIRLRCACDHLIAPTLAPYNQGSQNPSSSMNDKSWFPLPPCRLIWGLPYALPFSQGRGWEVGNQVFNLWLLLLLLLLCIWLYRRGTQPLPTTGVSFQATQDIFSFSSPHVPFSSECPR